ncbi:hypothetical protein WUBG_10391, partial [Wuchereria bancrofti]
ISGKDQLMVNDLRKTATKKFNRWFCSDSSRYQGTVDGNQSHQGVTEEIALLESNVFPQSVICEVSFTFDFLLKHLSQEILVDEKAIKRSFSIREIIGNKSDG